MDYEPLVSVYLPTYNRLKMLKRAVNSVLSQSYKNIELIVVDDGSYDGTVEYLEKLSNQDERVIFFQKKQFDKPQGAPASRNIAILEAKGQFVTGLDDDDYFHENRVEVLLNKYQSKYSCIASNFYKIGKESCCRNSYIGRNLCFNDLLVGNFLGNQVLVEKFRIINAGLFDEKLKASQDLDMWLRLVKRYGSAKRLSKALYYMDASHESGRISVSINRAEGTMQFIEKYNGCLSKGQVEYKLDSMGIKKISKIKKTHKIFFYGYDVVWGMVRSKLKLS